MTTIDNEYLVKISNNYFCKKCNYISSRKYNLDVHFKSIKHNNNVLTTNNNESLDKISKYDCNHCDKKFNDRAGLWRHKKKCINNCNEEHYNKNYNEPTDKELIMMLVKKNDELQNMMMEVIKNGTHNTNTNTNSLNKTFNLQFFLNETCKNAMNIMEFIESIQLQLSDLEKVGEQGYVEGISNIIINNLKGLDVTQRPIHCTDKKREVLYVKDEDLWQKEDQQNHKIRSAVKKISDKNMKLIPNFQKMHPDCSKSTSKIADKYNTIIYESMGGKGDNIIEKENKIITNISKEVTIDKI
uniref:C2H2-type domain-containing protein n=1 Tax=viral metagenome TaxID=1070528 RepID=A0A6C0IEY7_9ZZZZ